MVLHDTRIDLRNVLTSKLETCSNCQEQKGTVINKRERRGTGQSSKNNKGNIIETVKPRKCNTEKEENWKQVLNSIKPCTLPKLKTESRLLQSGKSFSAKVGRHNLRRQTQNVKVSL